SGKSGLLATSRPGQEVLERTALAVDPASGKITARFEVGFPAHGRTVYIPPLVSIFYSTLPKVVSQCLYYRNVDAKRLEETIFLADDIAFLRRELEKRSLVAFVADGSILARESGVSQRPMRGAVPFKSPESLAERIDLPHHGTIQGMGIREGVFLIVGGGYHGKSTLWSALERGVYNHIAGDGREFVVTRSDAMKIRAEDGRSVRQTDVSLFINDLPNGTDTRTFSTEDASGSTSQAAAVVEAMEAGTSLLLVDEDTCATNFMVRDELMRRVVSSDKEPITPFLSRMRQLYNERGISTVLVAGSSGSFFEVADAVIQMDEYLPKDVTGLAKEVYQSAGKEMYGQAAGEVAEEVPAFHEPDIGRFIEPIAAWKRPGARIKTKVLSVDTFSIDKENVDLRGLSQVVDREQTAAIAAALKYIELHIANGRRTVQQSVELLYQELSQKGLTLLFDGGTVRLGLACPRKEEVLGAINRFRRLVVHK
ncbi:MAG: ABC-ATPase domain-containing protein, partial [Lachnospiraceae bacterium]|nr:ABC-ATPase domain-containing protein [Lachnospiraceae bacterium]